VSTDDLLVCDDVSPAAWIGTRLTGAIGTVTGTVPAGFDAYVRICHPAWDGDGHWASWSRVAEATGRRAHALMQWHAVVGSPDHDNMEGSLWPGDDPERGNVVPRVLGPATPEPPTIATSACGTATGRFTAALRWASSPLGPSAIPIPHPLPSAAPANRYRRRSPPTS